jgi:transcription termination/antitermination protein NusA
MKSEFEIAITQLCSDRNLSPQIILEAIEAALVSAYKRNYGTNQNISVTLDSHTGQAHVYVKKAVVEQVQDEHNEVSLAEARLYKSDANIGDFVDTELTPRNFGRIAAQTAKQVIMQRIREAERDSVYLEYADRAGEIVNGIVRNVDARTQNVTISFGKAEAILAKSEQIPSEHYRFNQRLRVYVVEVGRSPHGPQITVSRTHRGLLRRLLELEVPEIFNGTVEIKAIAREPGSRSKVAVAALQTGVDPVGSCVGMRGVRIQNIVNELNGEKIDVVAWSASDEAFIANALSPAKVISVALNVQDKTAQVVVPDKSLSLAIGKEGQNARLAAKLTGWRIDIRNETEAAVEVERLAAEAELNAAQAKELEAARQAAAQLLAEAQASLDEEKTGLEVEESSEVEQEAIVVEVALPAEHVEQPGTEVPEPEVSIAAEVLAPEQVAQEVQVPVSADAVSADVAEGPVATAEGAEEAETAGEEGSEEWVEEGEETVEDGDLTDAQRKKARDKKERQRTLEYDERLGRVVARKKRKPSRRGTWEEDSGDY